jgi:uncharacterized membrane protein
LLITYPFAFLSGAAAFDVVAAARGDAGLARTAAHLRSAGILTALVAAVPGLVDYLSAVPPGSASRTATRHMVSNLSALGCFAAASAARQNDGPPSAATLALELAGTAMLSVGGWLGGSLVYHHHLGIADEHEAQKAEGLGVSADELLM